MKTAAKIQDGWYGLWPEGSPYCAMEIRDGQMHDRISQADAGSHRAGSNWHYIPVHDEMDRRSQQETVAVLDRDHHEAIIAMWDDIDPDMVHVEHLGTMDELTDTRQDVAIERLERLGLPESLALDESGQTTGDEHIDWLLSASDREISEWAEKMNA